MKKRILVLATILTLSSTSCSASLDLSEENSGLVSEYTASIILKNNPKYAYRLADVSNETEAKPTLSPTTKPIVKPETEPTVKPVVQPTTTPTAKTDTVASLENMLNLKNISLTYNKLECKTSITSEMNTSYSLTPRKGYQFVGLSFIIKNTDTKNQKIDLSSKGISYMLSIGEENTYPALLTILDSDFQFFHSTLEPKEERELLLLFEVEKNKSISSCELTAVQGKKVVEITVK